MHAMQAGQEVTVLPAELAAAACEAAGVAFNGARKKRAGGRGVIAELADGEKARVKCTSRHLAPPPLRSSRGSATARD